MDDHFKIKNSPPRQKHICSETFSLENAFPVSNCKRSELKLSWIQMTYKNVEKDIPTFIFNVFILLALLPVLTGSSIEAWRCFASIISWHNYKHKRFNLPKKAHCPWPAHFLKYGYWIFFMFICFHTMRTIKNSILEWLEHCHGSNLHSIFCN